MLLYYYAQWIHNIYYISTNCVCYDDYDYNDYDDHFWMVGIINEKNSEPVKLGP